jgi:putative alpha-1,2-mannosidase
MRFRAFRLRDREGEEVVVVGTAASATNEDNGRGEMEAIFAALGQVPFSTEIGPDSFTISFSFSDFCYATGLFPCHNF